MICATLIEVGRITSQRAHYWPGVWGNSAQSHVSIHLLSVLDVFKTQEKEPLIVVREEMNTRHKSLEHCKFHMDWQGLDPKTSEVGDSPTKHVKTLS
jgi:hypothetical protein